MNITGFVSKQNEELQRIYLISSHYKCIVLQLQKFHCHFSKLQDENLYEICSLVVAEENIVQG